MIYHCEVTIAYEVLIDEMVSIAGFTICMWFVLLGDVGTYWILFCSTTIGINVLM